MERTASHLSSYTAAREGGAFYRHPNGGYVRLSGPDRVDFLQRQTSNDVRKLSEHHAVLTVLTSPTARIHDVLWLIAKPDAIGIMTLPGRGSSTSAFLRGKIFFMDKVSVSDDSETVVSIDVDGPKLAETLGSVLPGLPGVDEVIAFDLGGIKVTGIGRLGFTGAGLRLLVPVEHADAAAQSLIKLGLVELSEGTYEVLRVEAGQPGAQSELTDDYTPLEVHLTHAISDAKGCYTGQEVIARQITYDKITRMLVGISLSQAVKRGAAIMVDGRSAGEVTSIVNSPTFGWIALAVVKRPHHEPGARVSVKSEVGDVEGVIQQIPFR